ncbi:MULTISPECIES: hypothetical protein [Devosia]|uniref:Uncharacterized protein n=1 Tax=Devosia sediminis TaxID=2798801 RepID=A0A934J131_9HYPH|nr:MULTISPECIES: hypothetical protein [Devosia]MBJ3787001.1 hypothetical protein [Devosia sediminis]
MISDKTDRPSSGDPQFTLVFTGEAGESHHPRFQGLLVFVQKRAASAGDKFHLFDLQATENLGPGWLGKV